MIHWINDLPPAELAVELMRAFGPDGLRSGQQVSSHDITGVDVPRLPQADGHIRGRQTGARVDLRGRAVLQRIKDGTSL